jgi:hypothetical protein
VPVGIQKILEDKWLLGATRTVPVSHLGVSIERHDAGSAYTFLLGVVAVASF